MPPQSSRRLDKIERRKMGNVQKKSQAQRGRFWMRIGGVLGGIVLLFAVILIAQGGPSGSTSLFGPDASDHEYAEFAACLTDADLVMYGADWCPHCQEQKGMFEEAFEYINYVNCDFNYLACQNAGVEGYPTWEFKGSIWQVGVQNFYDFAEVTGCELPDSF